MDNFNFDLDKYLFGNSKSIKDYVLLVRNNLFIFISISLVIIIAAISYAIYSKDIYESTVTLKITKQKQSILESSGALPEISSLGNDRFIANEIEVINNYDTRERVAKALIDSIDNSQEKSGFKLLEAENGKGINGHKTVKEITNLLKNVVSADQKEGMDVVEISAKSPSPYESALIVNTFADQYKEINLETNRTQLTIIRKFLEKAE